VKRNFARSGALAALIGAGVLVQARPADAGLGRAYSSVDTDRLVLGATVASTSAGPYTVHTLTLANRGVVKEFTRADGVVFAVVWRAPGRPDLRQLLCDSFETMQADVAARSGRHRRQPIMVNRTDLMVQSGGHPGVFWGVAMIPQLQPAGFSVSDLK
jgi:hypothetical protein